MTTRRNEFDGVDAFDVALGLYHWLQHNWEGQADPLYSAYCRLTAPGMFRAGPSAERFENVDDAARDVYDQLTRENYGDALAVVMGYTPEA